MIILYLTAVFSLIIGMFAVFTLVEKAPVKYLYYHYRIRKPLIWTIFILSFAYVFLDYWYGTEGFDNAFIPPLLIIGLSVILVYKVHQENWFKAVDFPEMTNDIENLPINDHWQIAIIESGGIIKAYPLDYVIHHHVINDKFGEKIISLTYCAMCRSIIPFDVTDIGPLFVASFKNGNMILGDRKTKTFFQQATFESVIGKLHPHSLTMIPFQVMPWSEIKKLNPLPEIVSVVANDFRDFNLPIHGVWKRITSTETTPGLYKKDTTFPARTRVIGLYEPAQSRSLVYLKDEIKENSIVKNIESDFILINVDGSVNCFKNSINGDEIDISLSLKEKATILVDSKTKSAWDLRGKRIEGVIDEDLTPIAISDEYWFSWKKYHPDSKLIRI